MARKQFTSLKDLEAYVQDIVLDSIEDNMALESEMKDAMQDAVSKSVYDAYRPDPQTGEPVVYARRYERGGLGDKRNMYFTYHSKTNKGTVSYFENTTRGSGFPAYGNPTDSMEGRFISELIENGQQGTTTGGTWYEQGEWSQPRPFAKTTVDYLLDDAYYPYLLRAFKSGLKKAGLDVK